MHLRMPVCNARSVYHIIFPVFFKAKLLKFARYAVIKPRKVRARGGGGAGELQHPPPHFFEILKSC